MSTLDHLTTKFEWKLDRSFANPQQKPKMSPVFALKMSKSTQLSLMFLNYQNKMFAGVVLRFKRQVHKKLSIKMKLNVKDRNNMPFYEQEFDS